MMFWYSGHWAVWQASLMWLAMIIFLGLLAWVTYTVVTAARHKPPQGGPDGQEARRILDERLARGDIDEAEYRRLRDLIGSGDQHKPAGTGTAR